MSAAVCADCGHPADWHSGVGPGSPCMGFQSGTSHQTAVVCPCPAYRQEPGDPIDAHQTAAAARIAEGKSDA